MSGLRGIGIAASVVFVTIAAVLPSQSDWQLVPQGGTWPSARSGAAWSADLGRGVQVLFGGVVPTWVDPQETWEFDGQAWTNVTSHPAPNLGYMVYDPARHRHVLFEHLIAFPTGKPQRTWEWDGVAWRDLTPTVSPPPRHYAAMAFDPVNGGVLLYGGLGRIDTWLWNGSTWRQLVPATTPSPMQLHLMVTDWRRSRIVMFSGDTVPKTGVFSETWVWDGLDWSRAMNANDPPQREGAAAAYDSLRDRVVLFGGQNAGSSRCFNETWEFDGARWQLLQTPSAPAPRVAMAMTYDSLGGRVLGFGGYCGIGPVRGIDNELWQYSTATPASYTPLGPGCRGTSGTPTLSAPPGSLPWIDDSFDVDLLQAPPTAAAFMATGFSASVWGGRPLPLDLSPFGAPGCPLRVAPFVWFPFARLASGTPRWRLSIPNDPRLAGLVFYNQALVLDPGANPLGAVVSDAQQGKVGIR